MQVVLVMFRGDGERRSFSIVHDVTVIGRREDCDFRIPLGEISRKHCRLIKDGDTLRAEDLGSSNGTYVNGERVQEAQLSPGDSLKVGSIVFVVQIDGVPAEHELQTAESSSASGAGMQLREAPQDDAAQGQEFVEATGEGEGEVADVAAYATDDQIAEEPVAGEHTEEEMHDHAGDNMPAAAGASGEYDPMSVLANDPDASSLGSMMDADRIAQSLMSELESKQSHEPLE
jgi:pSer/pThr/pTyr-binding forkhead associated (FHA) protein